MSRRHIAPRQGILTRFVPATNIRGSRYSATCEAGRTIIGADDSMNYEENHRAAATILAERFGWITPRHVLIGASLPRSAGYVWTTVDTRDLEVERDPSPEDWVCPECGSDAIHAPAWIDLRTGLDTGDEGPTSDYYCCACQDHTGRLVQRKDWRPAP